MTSTKKGLWNRLQSLFQAQDMTEGSTFSSLLKFSIPLLIGNIAQMLYNTVDSIVVGKYIGDAALSAIGASTPLQNLFLVFFMAIGAGVMVMVAQFYGAREIKNLGDTIGNAITLIFICSIFISAVATPLTPAMLRLMNTPVETFDMGVTYLQILFIGAIGNGLYNVLSGVLRGLGEALFPFLVLVGTSLLNVVLDIWFVAGLKMGIGGAAWATIISQILSSIVCLVKILTMKNVVKIKPAMLKLRGVLVGMIFRLGVPSGVSMGIMFAGTLFVQSLVNRMGYLVTAAITAMIRIDGFAVLPSQTFGMSSSTFTGQNVGANKMDRVKEGAKTVLVMCFTVTVVMVAALLLFGRAAIGLFTETESVIDMCMRFITIVTPAYILMVITNCLFGVMRGAGDTMGPMWISILGNVVIRVPLAYIIAGMTKSEANPAGDPASIFYSMVIQIAICVVLTIIYYTRGKWRGKAVAGASVKSK